MIINQNNKPESWLSFWFYKSFSKLHAVLEDHVVSMRWKTWHNTRSSDWPKWKQKAPFHWSKLTPACTYVTLEFDQNKVSRGQKVILVQQRKQAKIGFETFRSKYIKLCVSSDVGKSAHLTDTVKQQLRENKTATTVIPGGLTSLVQPLDVCLNKPFKDRLREKWMTWMMSGEKTFTPGGQLRAASLVTVCQWVKESWQELSKEMVERSFKKCGISNTLDGTEDDLVWEEEPDCDVYDDRITPEQWQELFGESDDEEEFHGFWRKTNKQTDGSFRSHQIWEKKWPMLHSFWN